MRRVEPLINLALLLPRRPREFRDRVTAVIPPEGGQIRGPERVGSRFIMQVPTLTPGLQIERSLRHAGIRARVAGVIRPLR